MFTLDAIMIILSSYVHKRSKHMNHSTLVSVRVKPEIAERLERLAESVHRSKSYIAAEAIEEYLEIHEWQIQAIHEGIAAVARGETKDFSEVKKHWEKQFENPNN